jgi:uncharacterized delta-60 repeat protein
MQTTDLGGNDGAWGVALQEDGKIVVAGGVLAAGKADGDFALARYNADGSLDESFGVGGKVITDLGSGSRDGATGVVIQGDGSLDTTFGGGEQSVNFGGEYDAASDVAIQRDGKIVAAGNGGREFGVARYNTDGSLDASFGGDGTQTTAFGSLWGDTGTGVGLHSDGRIVVVGTCCWTDLGPSFGLARFNPDGSPDTTFSDDGRQGTVFDPPGSSASANDLAIQPDGNIVVAGSTSFEGGGDFALARNEGGSTAPGTAPTNSSPPTVSGTATDGETLTVNAGAWAGSTLIQRTYQWKRCDSAGGNCVDIAAATTTIYTLTAADVGRTIRVRETATSAYGAGSADSAATAVVRAKPGAIVGTVRNAKTGTGIAKASVNCGNGYSAKTGTHRSYSIPAVAAGTYSCTASATRYAPATHSVTVDPGKTTTADFYLARS